MIGDDERSGALSMKPVVLAHVSDLHLPFEPALRPAQRLSKRQLSAWSWRRRGHLQSPRILSALATELRTAAPDHIAITGDVINFSLPDEYRQAVRWLQALAPAERISLVPGNHDALVPVAAAEGIGRWAAWTRLDSDWPFVHRLDGVSLIGLNSAVPTAPLLAQGRLGGAQLDRLARRLAEEKARGQVRVLLLHHPVAAGAIGRRKALVDAPDLRERLREHGAELILHGHARDARLDPVPGPQGPIPCLCVASSTALPNPRDDGARWHRLAIWREGSALRAEVRVRTWSVDRDAFIDAARYVLCLPPA